MWKQILSDKKTSLVIVTLAIVARLIHIVFFYNIRVDGMYQMLAMQNFVAGHGFSSSFVLPTDLSSIIYEPQTNWPPDILYCWRRSIFCSIKISSMPALLWNCWVP
jgi:hypothetical protein